MKRYLLTLCCILCLTAVHAQTTVNATPGTKLNASGSVQVNMGAGSFINNGTYTDNAGTFNVLGGVTFSGSGTTGLYYLGINTSSGTTLFSVPVTVNKTATILAGTVNAYAALTLNTGANIVDNGVLTNNNIEGLVTNATATSGCGPLSTNLSLNISGTSVLYQWQSSPDNSTWSNISGATNATYAASVSISTYYRCSLATDNSAYSQGSPGILISPTTLPSLTATVNPNPVCQGSSVSLTATSTGGNGAITYIWTGGSTAITNSTSITGTASITATAAGDNNSVYTLTATSIECGSAYTITNTLTVNALPTVGSTGGGVAICSGNTATLNGTGAVSYSWTGSVTNGVAFTPSVGNNSYTVTGTDANECTNTATTTVTVNALPTVSSTGGGVAICSGNTATLNGTGAVSYSWTGGVTNGVAFTPSVGNNSYTVTGTDANECTNTAITTVTVNALPTVGSTGGGVAICSGNTATLNGTGAVSYSWTGGVTNGVAFTPSVGNNSYTVTGTDANECTNTATTTVTVNALPTVSSTGGGVAICSGNTATLNGTGAVSYSWTGGVTNGVAFTPSVGNNSYTVTGTDANECTNTAITTVTVNALPTVGSTGGGVAICSGNTATLNGTGAVSYSWTGGVTNGVAFTPSVGNNSYTVTGTDANECTNTATTTVTVNALPTVGSTGGGVAICSGNTATLSGTGAVSYSWTGGVTNGVAFTPSVGNNSYTVTGTDANECTNTATTTVTVNALPTVGSTGGGVAICSGNTATLSGTGAVSYSWTGGVTNGVAFTPSVGNNSYTVTGTDANECTNTATTTVTVNALPTVGSTGGGVAICSGNTATLNGTGAVSYSWTGGVTNGVAFTPSVGNNSYTVTGTDANECTNTATTTVTVNALPTVGSTGGGVAICSGNTATLNGTGAVSYSWTGSVTNGVAFTPSVGNNSYTVTGTDANECTNTATTTVTVNALPTVSSTGGGVAICSGNTATLNGTGAVSYSWTGGVTNGVAFTPSVGNNSYTVTGTDANECTNTAITTVTVNALPTVGSTGGGVAICSGNTATLSGTGAVSYSWTGGITNGVAFTPSVGNNSYTVTGTDANECTNTATTTVTVNALPTVGSTGGGVAICSGNTATLNGTGAVSYSWTGGITNGVAFTPSVGNNSYTVTGTDANECTNTATTTVTVNALPTVGSTGGGVAICSGNTATLSGTGAVSYSWTGGITNGVAFTPSVGNNSYTVTGTDANECTNTATTTVTVNALPTVGSTGGGVAICSGNTATLNGTGAVSYSWTGGVTNGVAFTPSVGNNSYTVTGTDANECTNTATTTVTVNPIPVQIVGDLNLCVGLTQDLTDYSGGGTWSSDATGTVTIGSTGVATGVSPGTATIYYTFGTGCNVSVLITVDPTPTAISGIMSACIGSVTSLSDGSAGGSWISSNSNATVDGSGDVEGVSAGTVVITYIFPGGCYRTTVVTVNPLPNIILGNNTVCAGLSVNLSDATSGGSWSSLNTSVATVGTLSYPVTVTGVSAGTATLIYTLPATGCARSFDMTVNAITPVLGNGPVCAGSTIVLSDATGAGTWSSSSSSVATVDGSGDVTGVAQGTSKITYTSSEGCAAVATVSVEAISAILGNTVLCQNTNTTLSDVTSGGTWTSSNSSIASVGAGGIVAGGSMPGSATITYAIGSTGCSSNVTVIVNPITPILGAPGTVCAGSTITLSDATEGGVWSSSNSTLASVDVSGDVTGMVSGTVTITYLESATGCKATGVVTIAPISAIHGSTTMCSASTITLSDATTGGSWSSSNTSIATIGSTGSPVTVTGVSGGSTTISYMTAAGCSSSILLNVNQLPVIGGTNTVCTGLTTTLTDNISGGTWSSSNTAKAAVDGSGDVTGVASGTSVIYYVVASGCSTSMTVTVNTNPAAVQGGSLVCVGNVLSLSDNTAGGSWSTTSGVSLTGSGGNVTGVSAGTAGITYTLGTGCLITDVITVAAPPTAISGGNTVCAGSTLSLTDGVSGGTWSSSSLFATIGSSSGILTGVQGGTVNITYSTASGCNATLAVTINPIDPITGGTSACAGNTLALAEGTLGGTWSTASTAISIVGSSGLVTALSVDTGTVVYTIPSGCSRTLLITINPTPTPIGGVLSLCASTTTALSDDGSGTWSMASLVATVAGSTGVVTASNSYTGTATVTYTAGAGCTATAIVTVSPNPTPIQGATTECPGTTITLTDATAGGTWSASGDATASGTGSLGTLVAGGSGGAVTVTYMLPTGCSATAPNTVYSSPSPILGATTVCVGGVILLSDATSGVMSWSSSNSSIASAAGGDITGVNSGSATITYTINTGCFVTTTVNVINVTNITGNTSAMCPNASMALTDAAVPGTWSSSNNAVATVGTDGTVSALTNGTATIMFVTTGISGCAAATVVTVSTLSAITGFSSLCSNGSITLNDATAGGTWSSGNNAVATVGSGTGTVSAVGTGIVVISYTALSGCSVMTTLTVNAAPTGILGNTGVCLGTTTSLSDAISGGTWSSSVTSHATIGISSGIVTSVVNGTTTITYTAPDGCYAITTVTVNVQPGAITGVTSLCSGNTAQLNNSTTGGAWSSSGIGSIGSTGIWSAGASAGTTTISYIAIGGCSVSEVVTTNLAPGALGGPTAVCAGAMITLTDAVAGGTWSASSVLVSVDGLGDVTADNGASGTVTVTYTEPGGCFTTTTITVTNLPSAILGTTSVCSGSMTSLSNTTSGGVWSSGSTTVATVGSTGVVTGVAAGIGIITYSVGSGCMTSEIVTVYALPEAVTGNTLICAGSTSALADTGSGTWSCPSSLVATVNTSTGVVTASVSYAGTATVTYTTAYTGCMATIIVTVVPVPGAIQGYATECAGSTITLSDAIASGTWSGSGDAVVSGSGTSGTLVAGGIGGTATVVYTLPTGCAATFVNTINANPSSILGATTVCMGNTTILSDATSGAMSWSSSNTLVATVAGGDVTGTGVGSATITYTINTGCLVTTTINVIAVPVITGNNASICTGSSLLLTAGPGTWSSSATTIATVGTGGLVNGMSNGTATISFVSASGCMATTVVTVNTGAPISGSGSLCVGATATFSDATTGGVWTTSGDLTVVGSLGSVTAGASAGSGTVTYTLGSGCYMTSPVTVVANPSAILGNTTVCIGGTTILSDATSGSASWSSSNTTIATASGGNISGAAVGSATITYTVGTGCSVTTTLSVIGQPAIAGNTGAICPESTLSLTAGTGTWSSSNTLIASVGTGGVVTGIAGGTATITFVSNSSSGCMAITVITINSSSAITGSATVCSTGSTTLTDGITGGTWTSSNTAYATVGSASGIVSGVAVGSVIITYTTPLSCKVTSTLAVTTGPSAIGGASNVCVNGVITLTDATGGGAWSSSTPAIGTVDGSGDVTGVSAGPVTITYTSGGCSTSTRVTVNAIPEVVNAPSSICLGTPTTLTDLTVGGAWSVSGGTATIGSTGVITGTSTGTATVSYTLPSTGCGVGKSVAVISTAGSISGNSAVCIGLNITLSDAGGGTWTSSNTAVVTVGSASGTVNGIGSGTATITYSLGGCYVTAIATVNGAVGVIKGATSVCQGATISLSDATTGGTWSSSSTAIATLDASTGSPVIVSAVNTGSPSITTVNIGYASAAGCTTSVTVTVNPLPGSINGNLALCPSSTSLLTDGITGGIWSMISSDASVVGSTGVVTASSGYTGTATISYTIGGCSVTGIVTVNPNPNPIQGATYECAGLTTALTDATAGGTWTGGGDATVSGTGTSGTLVAGATSGSATVTYTLPTGCKATSSNTIYASPQPIQGNFNLCVGLVNILSDASAVSSWSSSNTSIAKAAGGDITGVAPGTATITFKTSATGSCTITQVVTVSAMPVVTAINGPATISNGSPVSISDATLGGIWTSSNTSVIVLGGSTGNPIGATAETTTGSSVISYAVTISGCTTTVTKTFSAASAAHPGSGTATVYAGSVVSINDNVASGAWSSSDNGIATVDENGLVTGIAPGIASITHTVTGDDGVTATGVTNVVVSAVPATISLSPNPNKGTFVVRGTTGSVSDEEVTLEVTDVLGQVIYKNKVTAQGGKLNETITLNSVLANGMYILNVQSGTENKTLHFVIEQ